MVFNKYSLKIIFYNNLNLSSFDQKKESLVIVQKDEGEIIDEKVEKKTERSPEKLDRTLEKKIVNVDRNQVKNLIITYNLLYN